MKKPKLYTEVEIPKAAFNIKYGEGILLLGSCFTENIGNVLTYHGFKTRLNPHGIIYNPLSLAESIIDICENKEYTETDLDKNEDLWFSFKHHGLFSDLDKTKCLSNINNSIQLAHSFIKEAKYVIVSLGTAWVYELIKTKEIVANCHKLPNTKFTKRLLSVNEISAALSTAFTQLKKLNPSLNIILTVSPIRHWSNGAYGNNLSKSSLLLAVNCLVESKKNTMYFPSYEIVLDQLRDYRFYKEDLLHPNNTAIDIIWDAFKSTYLNEQTCSYVNRFAKIKQALAHKAFNPNSAKHQQFLKATTLKLNQLKTELPEIELN